MAPMRRAAMAVMVASVPIASMIAWTITNPAAVVTPKVIALSSVTLRVSADSVLWERATVFDSLIEHVVRAQGFAVVPHDSTEAAQQEVSDSIGGAFDPMTGKVDTLRAQAIRSATRRRLVARFDADLWLRPYIVGESVPFEGERATWHGTTEITGATGGLGRLLIGTKQGRIPALTLEVYVSDTLGKVIYGKAGGIQLLMKAGRLGAKPREVPNAEIFASPVRNAHAVEVALDSLSARVGVERTIAAGLDRGSPRTRVPTSQRYASTPSNP